MITNIIVLVLIFAAIGKGYHQGFIKGFGSLVSAVISASVFLYVFRMWDTDSIFKIILIIGLFVVFWLLFKLSYWLLSKVLKILYVIPFMKSLDKVFGGILGILEGILAVTILNYVIISTTWLNFIPWESGSFLNFVLTLGKSMIIGI